MRVKPATDGYGEKYRRFDCPGCKGPHVLPVTGPKAWGFNNNDERPTFTPSILVHEVKAGPDATLVAPGTVLSPRCHSFVTDGRIQFLSDCTHTLAGQTVDLPEIAGD